MGKIYYPSDLDFVLNRLYDSGKLFSYLKTGEILDFPISRVWKGRIRKTGLSLFNQVVYPWMMRWADARKRLSLYGISVSCVVDDSHPLYRVYKRVHCSDIKGVFRYLGKEADLRKFLSFEKSLEKLGPCFVTTFYKSKSFREWVYGLPDYVSDTALNELDHSAAEWARIILEGIVVRCKIVPEKPEFSRNVYLPFLHTKFLERNFGKVRLIYNMVTGESVDNKELLASKLNILFGEPVFSVVLENSTEIFHLDSKQLNARFLSCVPAVVLLSENSKNMGLYDYNGMVVIGGVGKAVVKLFEKCQWLLQVKTVYYWGDCDMDGYSMLNQVRGFRKDIHSVLMTGVDHIKVSRVVNDDNLVTEPSSLVNLTLEEFGSCCWVKQRHARIEQERIEKDYVEAVLKQLSSKV